MSRRIAVSVMPLENRREVLIYIATAAERLGYEAFFLPETWAYDTTIVLAEAAVQTRRIRLDLPIYLAALGPETIRLTGELADWWLPYLYPHTHLAEGIALLREGAARRADPDGLPAVCPSVPVAVAEDAGKARERVAWFIAFYLTSMGTLYRGSLVRQGFGKQVEAVLAANPKGQAGIVPPEAEALLEHLTVFGTPEQARARLARWYEADAALPILLLPPNLPRDGIDFTLNALRP